MYELIKEIAVNVAREFDNYIYLQDIGEGFKRPSFFIYHVSTKQTDLSRWSYANNILVKILYFAPLNKYKMPSREEQLKAISKLQQIFSGMGIKLGEKFIRIKEINVGYTEGNDAFLQLTLECIESRKDLSKERFESMKEIYIKESGV